MCTYVCVLMTQNSSKSEVIRLKKHETVETFHERVRCETQIHRKGLKTADKESKRDPKNYDWSTSLYLFAYGALNA